MTNRYTKPADFWQERDFGQKISATFEFMAAHWRPLGRVLLYIVLPGAIAVAIGMVLLQRFQFASELGTTYGGSSVNRLTRLFTSPVALLQNALNTVLYALLVLSVYGYLRCCLYGDTPGQEVTVRQVWAVVQYKFLSTFLSFYGLWLLLGLAALLLVVPGIYLGVVFSLFFAVHMLEDTGFQATLSRCSHLVSGKWWSTCGLLACTLFLVYLVYFSFGMAAVLLGGFNRLVLPGSSQPATLVFVVSAIVSLLRLLLYPPVLLALAFQYFNLVERHEGRGLRLLVDDLGTPQTATAVKSDHYRPDDEGEY